MIGLQNAQTKQNRDRLKKCGFTSDDYRGAAVLPPFFVDNRSARIKFSAYDFGKGRKLRNAVFKILKGKFHLRCLFVKYGSRQHGKVRMTEKNCHVDEKNARNKKKYVQNPSFSTFT